MMSQAARCSFVTAVRALRSATTGVDVANIRLSRPKPKRTEKWVGLEGLESREKGSLIPSTLEEMDTAQQGPSPPVTLEERKRQRRALDGLGIPEFTDYLAQHSTNINRSPTSILQINVGLYCNQACSHCHVDSSPRRKESMSREVADACLTLLRNSPEVTTLDLTGGAPELQPQFRYLVQEAVAMGREVIDRCNLTVLEEPGQEDLADFLAAHKVRVVASLPCYGPRNVNQQRGSGVFDRSIRALLRLNERGYGVEGSGLELDLVYNPLGAFLPPPQPALKDKYKEELFDAFGIVFNELFTITNMPILRFADFLARRGELQEYMNLLVQSFNVGAAQGVMCKDTVNVRWDGRLYDCDFNQQLGLGMGSHGTGQDAPAALQGVREDGYSVFDVQRLSDLHSTRIILGNHCYGCTAGQGSSCQGATAIE